MAYSQFFSWMEDNNARPAKGRVARGLLEAMTALALAALRAPVRRFDGYVRVTRSLRSTFHTAQVSDNSRAVDSNYFALPVKGRVARSRLDSDCASCCTASSWLSAGGYVRVTLVALNLSHGAGF